MADDSSVCRYKMRWPDASASGAPGTAPRGQTGATRPQQPQQAAEGAQATGRHGPSSTCTHKAGRTFMAAGSSERSCMPQFCSRTIIMATSFSSSLHGVTSAPPVCGNAGVSDACRLQDAANHTQVVGRPFGNTPKAHTRCQTCFLACPATLTELHRLHDMRCRSQLGQLDGGPTQACQTRHFRHTHAVGAARQHLLARSSQHHSSQDPPCLVLDVLAQGHCRCIMQHPTWLRRCLQRTRPHLLVRWVNRLYIVAA